MHATVIDTLRYADLLKEAGVDARQAGAMARALNAELTEGLVTKADLDKATQRLEKKVDLGFARSDAKFEAMDTRFEAMDTKFEALASQFKTQSRHVFLILAVIAALGLYNAVRPHIASGPEHVAARTAPAEATGGTAPAPRQGVAVAPVCGRDLVAGSGSA